MESIVEFIAMFDGIFDPVEQSIAFNKEYHAKQVLIVQEQSKKCESIHNIMAYYGYKELVLVGSILHQNLQFLTDIMRGMIINIVARRIAPGECYICLEDEAEDPMVCLFCLKVLGLSRSASAREIKQAYKKLALEFHPDKNDAPDANEKFMQINAAYEILNDAQKKEQYDKYGTVSDHGQMRHGGDNFFNGRQFDEWFFGGFGDGSRRQKQSVFEKHRLTHHMYVHSVLEQSYYKPYIIFAYSTYCMSCFTLQSYWTDAVNDLEPLGYGIGTVNYIFDGNLFEKLRIGRLPSLLVLVEGKVVHYRGSYADLNARTIRMFARDAIPNTFMMRVNNYNGLKRFLEQWQNTNKPSVLFMGANKEPRLRYLLLAMRYSHFARFGYVNIMDTSNDVREMKIALDIRCSNCENVLIFKENPETGEVAKLQGSASQFTTEQLNEFIEKNKFLTFPKLSSMSYLDHLCPVSSRSQRHFCFIFPIENFEPKFINSVRAYIKDNGVFLDKHRAKLVQISTKAQSEFMKNFDKQGHSSSERKSFLVMWRHEYVKAKFVWMPIDVDQSLAQLRTVVENVFRGDIRITEVATVTKMLDEFEPSLFTKFSRRIVRMALTLWFHLTKEDVLPVVSVVGTMVFILLIGYVLNYMVGENKVRAFDQQPEKPPPYSTEGEWHPEDPKANLKRPEPLSKKSRAWTEMEPLIHELRAETYFGLIRLLKPGCRSIIVLVDNESKDVMLRQYARHIYPLRKNKTFSFGYLNVDKNLHWFRQLLEHICPASEDGTNDEMAKRLKGINPKQTLGTVLVLCGYKLWFTMYHPLHPCNKPRNSDDSDSDEPETSTRTKKISQENVLDGLPNFLDRLLEGTIRRYYVPEWPETLK
ncbi:unnamed protein product [Bursaphelenchus okinawaensis]|uniref:J domain-containing protein n=1 Tax=Bursaphelenchus okinawaensis TaxID=465554 RepID=A0A811JUG2_9BILA|nr:unnamed protein product [Bursaphelenchus okinawaensis]CAG9083601.1 unnamed protein product [Bursaphelenchus okinawaensis]